MTCIVPTPATDDDPYYQGFWARVFGAFIQSGRENAGLDVESAARLAGMYTEQLVSMEAGDLLPTSRGELHRLAAALDIDWGTMTRIVAMCRNAWGLQ